MCKLCFSELSFSERNSSDVYVFSAADYVPKVSKALLKPARYAIGGVAVVTFLGLGKIAVMGPGGIKGAVKAVWNPKPKKELEF